MTTEDYESRKDTVLAWKKSQRLGRFDPNAPEIEKSKIEASFQEVEDRGMSIFCLVHHSSTTRPSNVINHFQASKKASAAASCPRPTTAAASSLSSAKFPISLA